MLGEEFSKGRFGDVVERELRRFLSMWKQSAEWVDCYVFGLWITEEAGIQGVCAVANTLQHLEGVCIASHHRNRHQSVDMWRHNLRFDFCADWKWFKSCDEADREISKRWKERFERDAEVEEVLNERCAIVDAAIVGSCLRVLQRLDEEGEFGRGEDRERVTLLVLGGDVSRSFVDSHVHVLNPPSVVARYFLPREAGDRLLSMPGIATEERLQRLVDLFVSAHLDASGAAAAQLKATDVSRFDVGSALVATGSRAVEALLDVVDEHAPLPGSQSATDDRSAMPDDHVELVRSIVWLIRDIAVVSDDQIVRLQSVLHRTVEWEASLTLAKRLSENIARVLSTLRPGRFPLAMCDDRSNHLCNWNLFL